MEGGLSPVKNYGYGDVTKKRPFEKGKLKSPCL
jgi:hypothetical protein